MIPNIKRKTPTPLGILHYDDFSSNTIADYTVTGQTVSITSGDMRVSGGTGDFTKSIQFSQAASLHKVTLLELWSITITYQMKTVGATNYAIWAGIKGINNNSIWLNASGKTGGVVFEINDGVSKFQQISSTILAADIDDEISVTFTRSYQTYSVSYQNITKGYSGSATFNELLLVPNAIYAESTGRFSFFSGGGTQWIHDITITSTQLKEQQVLFEGDSITMGLFAGDWFGRYANKTMEGFSDSWNIGGGNADQSVHINQRISQIVALAPRYVYLAIGSNDVVFGGAYTTYIPLIVSALRSAGIGVVFATPVARNTANFTTFITWLTTNYPYDVIVDINLLTRDTTVTTDLKAIYEPSNNDHTHPNPLGHSDMGALIKTTAKAMVYLRDVNPPILQSILVTSGNQITLTYNEPLDTASTPAGSDFSLAGYTVSSVSVTSSRTVVLTFSTSLTAGSYLFSYTAGANKIQDLGGNPAPNFSQTYAVTFAVSLDMTANTTRWITSSNNVSSLNFGNGAAGLDGAFSLSFWWKPTSATQQVLLSYSDSGLISYWVWYYPTTNIMVFDISNGDTTNRIGLTVTRHTLSTWGHYTFTYDGLKLQAGTKLYKDGISVGTSYASGTYTGMPVIGTNKRFLVGRDLKFASTTLKGYLDQVCVFNKSLSALEATELYNSGHILDVSAASFAANIKLYMKFSFNLADSSSNAYTFAVNDATTPAYSTDQP